MVTVDLIDTTEMYLKTIFELEEDGITPLRARIVDRLGHSGPTVSQTVARMERDGLVTVREDRRLDLTPEGRRVAREVMRKHRLAERLLVDVIGMDWTQSHDEACRWEHVMSTQVEKQLSLLLGSPSQDPYGNPIPGYGRKNRAEESLEVVFQSRRSSPGSGDAETEKEVTLCRIGEPIQAQPGFLGDFDRACLRPGSRIRVRRIDDVYELTKVGGSGEETVSPVDDHAPSDTRGEGKSTVFIPRNLGGHLFVICDQ